MRRLAELFLLALVVATPGCWSTRVVSALFSSQREVVRTTHPVRPDARLAVLWVGHATALVQIDDKVVLTDPVFTSTVGQLSKRLVEPGLDPKFLPPVDAVLISHSHYDHLSLGSLEMIEPRVRALMLPPGGTAYLTDWFSFPAYELRAWQTWEKDGLRVTAVPVNHGGGRYGIDAAWMTEAITGYVIEYHGLKVYFGGDSAYDQRVFVEVGARFPNIDLALVPIGPIEPRVHMRRLHMDPHEAVQAFIDLGAARMVPIHYDTFVNSGDDPGDALRALSAAQKKWGFRERVAPLAIGERRIFIKPGEEPKSDGTKSAPTSIPKAPAPVPTTPVPDDDKFE